MDNICYSELFEEWFKVKELSRPECVKTLELHIYNTRHVTNEKIPQQLTNFVKINIKSSNLKVSNINATRSDLECSAGRNNGHHV